MRSRSYLAAAGVAALAVPGAVAVADGLGPHASWYDQHPRSTTPHNDVSIVVHRKTARADIHVANYCLGSTAGQGTARFPNVANALNVRVHRGRIAFTGRGTIYDSTGSHPVRMKFRATIAPRRATGTANFPGKPCKTIHFTAKLAQRTR